MKLYIVVLFAATLIVAACNQSVGASTQSATSMSVTATVSPVANVPSATPSVVSPTAAREISLEAGQWTYIFYHDGLEKVVLVNGGPEQGKPADDPLELWSWDGKQWSLIVADVNGPTWRNWPAVAYDTAHNVLVIHGGLQGRRSFDETWEWDGQAWTQHTVPGPEAREGALMAYDESRGQMLLFGGSTPDMEIHADTWAWNGEVWQRVSESGPAARFPGGMVYDAARQEILLYSGHFAAASGEFVNYDDLWAWDGSSWREIATDGPTPGHRTHAGFVYDPVEKEVLLIGSGSDTFLRDVWAWDGTIWEDVPTSNTPARSGNNVAYDPARDRFVLFGGVERPGGKALDDTWEWDRTQWSCISNCQ